MACPNQREHGGPLGGAVVERSDHGSPPHATSLSPGSQLLAYPQHRACSGAVVASPEYAYEGNLSTVCGYPSGAYLVLIRGDTIWWLFGKTQWPQRSVSEIGSAGGEAPTRR